jgi:hypothetical protein
MRQHALILVLSLGLASCADFGIRKVPQRGDYQGWDDTRQEQVDAMSGFRFYLRRPFVAVHTPFPVSSTTFVLNGHVSADGLWVSIDMSHAPTAPASEAWKKVLRFVGWTADADGAARVDAAKVLLRDPAPAGGKQPAGAQGAEPEPVAETEPSGGIGSYKVRSDLDGLSVIPFRKYFDITYLPDHDEQYVVDAAENFGNVSVDLTWGPGNSLLSMDATVDNSAIVAPLLNAYQGLVKAAGQAVISRINPVAAVQGAVAQGAAGESRIAEGGTPVTVIVHVVRFAAPGLYPILKPKELHQRQADRWASEPDVVVVGQPPAPCVAYGVYEEIFVEAALATPTARFIGTRFADEAGGRPLVTERAGDGQKSGSEKSNDEILVDLNAHQNLDGYQVLSFEETEFGDVAVRLKLLDPAKRMDSAPLKTALEAAWKDVTGRSNPVEVVAIEED